MVHARIEELKRSDKWSLRQRTKFQGPLRPKVHWDRLLDEMKWMRVDFREERKLKIALCYEMANAVNEYWKYGKEACCIQTKPIVHLMNTEENTEMELEPGVMKEPMTEGEAVDPQSLSLVKVEKEEAATVSFDSFIPSLFVSEDNVKESSPLKLNMKLESLNSASRELFNRLPTQQLAPPESNSSYVNEFEALSITSITKFLAAPELSLNWQKLIIEVHPRTAKIEEEGPKPSSSSDGPLFGHEFHKRYLVVKPPQPPSLKYLEFRAPTIWLPQDDQKLLKLSKEYQFNWNIISAMFVNETTYGYQSNIERRTPWLCFERWLQLTPSFLPSELKGPYAHQAQAWLEASLKAQTLTKRRISPLGVGVESIQRGHRRLRWASMFDGIRKSMKNRENMARPGPQVHRKFSSTDNMAKVPTPSELSKLKFDRDRSIEYNQQQRNPLGIPGTPGARMTSTNSAIPALPSASSSSSGFSGMDGNQANAARLPNSRPNTGVLQSQGINPPNGLPATARPVTGINAVNSQAAMGAQKSVNDMRAAQGMPAMPGSNLPVGVRLTPEQVQLIQRQQQTALQQSQQFAPKSPQQPNAVKPPSMPQGSGQAQTVLPTNDAGLDALPNASMGNMNAAKRTMATPAVDMSNVTNVPNRLAHSMQHPHVINLINQIAAQYPNFTSEQVTQIAQNKIQKYIQLQKQRAQQQQQQQQPQAQAPQQQPMQQQPQQRQLSSQQVLQLQQMQMQAQAQQQALSQNPAAGPAAGNPVGVAKQLTPQQLALLQQQQQQRKLQLQQMQLSNQGMPLSPQQQQQQLMQQVMKQQQLQQLQKIQQQQQQLSANGLDLSGADGSDLDTHMNRSNSLGLGSSPIGSPNLMVPQQAQFGSRPNSVGITPPPPPPSI